MSDRGQRPEAGIKLSDHPSLFLRLVTLVTLSTLLLSANLLWTLQMTHPRQGWTSADPSNYKMQQWIPRLTVCGRINPIQSQKENVPTYPWLQTSLDGTSSRVQAWSASCTTHREGPYISPTLCSYTGGRSIFWDGSSEVVFLPSSFCNLNLTNKVIARPVEQGNHFKEQFRRTQTYQITWLLKMDILKCWRRL